MKRNFQTPGNPLTGGSVGSFGISGQHNWEEKQQQQNMRLIATPSGEVAQMLTATSREQGLNTEVRFECLG